MDASEFKGSTYYEISKSILSLKEPKNTSYNKTLLFLCKNYGAVPTLAYSTSSIKPVLRVHCGVHEIGTQAIN